MFLGIPTRPLASPPSSKRAGFKALKVPSGVDTFRTKPDGLVTPAGALYGRPFESGGPRCEASLKSWARHMIYPIAEYRFARFWVALSNELSLSRQSGKAVLEVSGVFNLLVSKCGSEGTLHGQPARHEQRCWWTLLSETLNPCDSIPPTIVAITIHPARGHVEVLSRTRPSG
jgi:hypothetical protein